MLIYDQLLKTPDIDGIIYLKEKSRKSWKKHFCVLRSSGLYFVPKGKSKVKILFWKIFLSIYLILMYRKILFVWQNLKMLNYFLVLDGKRNLNHLVIIVLHWRFILFYFCFLSNRISFFLSIHWFKRKVRNILNICVSIRKMNLIDGLLVFESLKYDYKDFHFQ